MEAVTIGHLAVTTKDMEKSLDFYTRVLGFKKVFEINNPTSGEPWINYLYIGAEQFIELFYDGATDNPWNSNLRGFNHICMAVPDIHAIAKQIEAAGYPLDKQPKCGCDNNWQCWVTDPDGVRIEMMQISEDSPHRKAIRENA